MRYLLIDHITEWKSGVGIKGVKNVAMSEDFLEFHFPKHPIMPGVLLIEALAQLAGWLEAASSDFKNWLLISKVRKSNFYGFALTGDQVELEVQPMPEAGESTKAFRGIGMVKGKKKITVEFEADIIPLTDIEDIEEQKRFFKFLRRELI
ncbi:MAG TPA: beta-hydroxyacyl-ACP dehydratase [Nitrospirae bacterium]|nr:3-hydroxyacyl-[acyl-carrier-protein] dehydratase FabZ [bacterium BMS3Abin10]GBE37600.1 3-hydroxyacyl-[acyl-carrier-protein] dehydratase FabZ [bacterium BMS3Bbin08]HDH51649.1 beta-hydroxyacyl-ACP dehydratase [Nitrospirota bacterium]HDK82371.1 beta-hydroxyacyl-ACP dehydratase [Nitrospirota bacterium]HDO26336.1 beta-hydroxyacyl-ACP dehydratase [Nitrospirota bacterium]